MRNHKLSHLRTTSKAINIVIFDEFQVVFTISSFVGNPVQCTYLDKVGVVRGRCVHTVCILWRYSCRIYTCIQDTAAIWDNLNIVSRIQQLFGTIIVSKIQQLSGTIIVSRIQQLSGTTIVSRIQQLSGQSLYPGYSSCLGQF